MNTCSHAVDFSPDGQTIASCDSYGTVHLIDILGNIISKPLQGNMEPNHPSVAFSPNGEMVASGGSALQFGTFLATLLRNLLWDIEIVFIQLHSVLTVRQLSAVVGMELYAYGIFPVIAWLSLFRDIKVGFVQLHSVLTVRQCQRW
jgi:hypothetical protein